VLVSVIIILYNYSLFWLETLLYVLILLQQFVCTKGNESTYNLIINVYISIKLHRYSLLKCNDHSYFFFFNEKYIIQLIFNYLDFNHINKTFLITHTLVFDVKTSYTAFRCFRLGIDNFRALSFSSKARYLL